MDADRRAILLAEARRRLQASLDRRKSQPPPQPPPRYDETFWRGVEWLDSL